MVTITVEDLKSWKDKTVGLLGSKKPHPVLLHTRFGIHTFGMRYPIDVIVLDKAQTIKKVQTNIVPNKLFFWNPSFDTVLELPNGMIGELGLKVGMKITLRSL